MKSIYKMGFFYKRNSIQITENVEEFIKPFEENIEWFKKEVEKDGTDWAFEQMEILTENFNEMSEKNKGIWCMNIYHLTKCGYLKSDNNNGLLYMYAK